MIPGVVVNLGGTDYTVPPLNLRLYFVHEAQIDMLTNPAQHSMKDYATAASAVLLAVLQRNYPDLTAEQFAEVVDFASLSPLVASIFGQSGFNSRPLAAANPPSASPEATSSATSSPPQDGSPTTSSNG